MRSTDVPNEILRFWEKAGEDRPLYHIATGIQGEDEAAFFQSGVEDTANILQLLSPYFNVAGRRVLEVGSGIGRMTGPLVDAGAHVVAVDIASSMLNQMPDRLPEWERRGCSITRIRAAVDHLPLPDASVDAAFSYLVLHHLPTRAMLVAAIGSMGRVVRPGGRVAFQTCNWRPAPRTVLGRLRRGQLRAPAVARPFRMHYASVNTVDSALEKGGLRLVHRTGEGTWHLWNVAERV